MTRRLAIVTAVILILSSPPFAKKKGDDFVWVGVMRNDGILAPVGLYCAGEWSSPWTDEDTPSQAVTSIQKRPLIGINPRYIPKSWLGVPGKMPTKWYLLTKEGASVPFTVLKAVVYNTHCSQRWGLHTDYVRGIEDYDYSWPKPTVGIAVSSKVSFLPIEDMGKSIPKGLDIWPLLKPEFEKQEEIKIEEFLKKVPQSETDEGYLRDSNIPVSRERRAKLRIDIEKVFAARGNIRGEKLYYIEASRKYHNPRQTEDYCCLDTIYFGGWLWAGKRIRSFAKGGASFADSGGKGIDTTVPWVALNLGGTYYLVSVNYGYEWEYFTVLEVGNILIWEILNIQGGGC